MSLITYHNYTMIELYYQLLADLEAGNEERALSPSPYTEHTV